MKPWTFIFALTFASDILPQTVEEYELKVHVVDSLSGTPIAGANVVLDDARGERTWGRTDTGGVFSARTHSAGKHLLTITKRGYYAVGGGTMGTMIDLQRGASTETTVRMRQLGVIAGRVLDQYGDPIGHAIVRTMERRTAPGEDEYYDGAASATTDDRGEYRIANVEPGKHYIGAEYSGAQEDRFTSRSKLRWPDIGGFVLFPNTTDIRKAQEVEVSAGQVTRINEMHLNMLRAVKISGRITPPQHDKVLLDIHLSGVRLGLNAYGGFGSQSEDGSSFNLNVLPGTYVLSARSQTGRMSPGISFEVRDKDISNLELKLESSYEISGRVTVDGQGSLDYSKLSLVLVSESVKIGSDGAFYCNLYGHKASYLLQGLPQNWYVKEVLVGGQRVGGRIFEVQPGSTEMAITLSPRGAQLDVKVESRGPGIDAPIYLALLPEQSPLPDLESILRAERDESGTFVVRGVAPGSYRVFSLDVANWALIMRPDLLMEKYGNSAPLVKLVEGERKSMVVPPTEMLPE